MSLILTDSFQLVSVKPVKILSILQPKGKVYHNYIHILSISDAGGFLPEDSSRVI